MAVSMMILLTCLAMLLFLTGLVTQEKSEKPILITAGFLCLAVVWAIGELSKCIPG